jgi:hypothetical protein
MAFKKPSIFHLLSGKSREGLSNLTDDCKCKINLTVLDELHNRFSAQKM